jgi:hypothetical protein
MRISVALLVVQCLLIAALLFGDIGFDKPGRFGLDYDDGLFILALYGVAFVLGLAYAIRWRRWRGAGVQLAIPAAVLLVTLAAPHMRRPLDAGDYQHLVGKSKADVRKELGDRSLTSGAMADERGEREFESYKGITIYYAPRGEVLSVEANDL